MALVAVVGRRTFHHELERMLGEQVGAALADAGHVVLTGGRGGSPATAASAAIADGGTVICATPLDWPAEGECTIELRTGLSIPSRNVFVGSVCEAMVALPGSHGTWQEMTVALDRRVPVIVMGEHVERLPAVLDGVPTSELAEVLARMLGVRV